MLRVILSLALVTSLAACGNSRLNPFNWFGGDRETRVEAAEAPTPDELFPIYRAVLRLVVTSLAGNLMLAEDGAPGVLDLQDIAYFVSVMVFTLSANGVILQNRRTA